MHTIIYKGSSFVVVNLEHDLPRHDNWPYGSRWSTKDGRFVRGRSQYVLISDRKVKSAWLHHTAGNTNGTGFKGPLGTASFVVRNPRLVGEAVDSSFGRGWPGMPYHLYIPFAPVIETREKLPIVYQCWGPDWHIWHTKGNNRDGYGIVCQGWFRQTPGKPGTKNHPSKRQFDLVAALWDEWVKPMLGLTDANLYGHADATKPACPGGTLYDWVIGRREQRTIRQLESSEHLDADHDCT